MTRFERGKKVEHRDPRPHRWLGAGVLVLMSALFVPDLFGAVGPNAASLRAISVFGMTVCLLGVWRGLKAGSIRLSGSGIRECGLIRDHFWAWEDVERASVEILTPPFKAVKMRALVIHPRAEKRFVAGYTIAPPKDGESSWVDMAAHEINQRIATLGSG